MAKEYPEHGDIVVVKITKVLNYGVFAELLEFEDLTGFVHVSQVTSRWVKNIRAFVKENQIRAAKVLRVDRLKDQIDLSLEKVPPRVQRKKIEELKQFKRSQKLIELMAKEQKKDFNDAWQEVAEPLLENYDTLYEAFEEISLKGKDAVKGVKPFWVKPLLQLVEKNIVPPKKTVKGLLELHSFEPDGVEVIKKALAAASKTVKGADVEMVYIGSSKFQVKVTAPDYKTAERDLKLVGEKAVAMVKQSKGQGKFESQARLN